MLELAFYKAKHGNWLDKLINWWTGGTGYSHVEIVVEKREDRGYFVGASTSPYRVVSMKMYTDLYEWDYLIISEPEIRSEEVLEFFYQHKSKKYDWLAIFFTFLFRFKSDDPKRLFCSEFVGLFLKEQGIKLPKKPSRMHPNRLYKYLQECLTELDN